jgi:hypothetical protein
MDLGLEHNIDLLDAFETGAGCEAIVTTQDGGGEFRLYPQLTQINSKSV